MLLGVLLSFSPIVLGGHIVRLVISAVDMFNYKNKLGGFNMEILRKRERTKADKVETLIKEGNLGAQSPPA